MSWRCKHAANHARPPLHVAAAALALHPSRGVCASALTATSIRMSGLTVPLACRSGIHRRTDERSRSATAEFWGRTIHTVFIGGGTPSLFSAQAIADLLAGCGHGRGCRRRRRSRWRRIPEHLKWRSLQAFARPASRGFPLASRASTMRICMRWAASQRRRGAARDRDRPRHHRQRES